MGCSRSSTWGMRRIKAASCPQCPPCSANSGSSLDQTTKDQFSIQLISNKSNTSPTSPTMEEKWMECSTSAAISCQHHGLPPSGNIHQEEIRKKIQCNGNVEGKCMEFSGDGLQTCNQRKAWKKLCFFAKLLMLLMLSLSTTWPIWSQGFPCITLFLWAAAGFGSCWCGGTSRPESTSGGQDNYFALGTSLWQKWAESSLTVLEVHWRFLAIESPSGTRTSFSGVMRSQRGASGIRQGGQLDTLLLVISVQWIWYHVLCLSGKILSNLAGGGSMAKLIRKLQWHGTLAQKVLVSQQLQNYLRSIFGPTSGSRHCFLNYAAPQEHCVRQSGNWLPPMIGSEKLNYWTCRFSSIKFKKTVWTSSDVRLSWRRRSHGIGSKYPSVQWVWPVPQSPPWCDPRPGQ